MTRTEAGYKDDLGEMATIGDTPLPDFLPGPENLIFRDEAVGVHLSLRSKSLDFFRREADRRGVPHERLISALLDAYVDRQD